MKTWPVIDLPISNLRFDQLNARFLRRYKTKKEITGYLIENYKIPQLTKSIVRNGYMTGDLIVVIQENDKFIVVEGNRRLCALRSIIDFDKNVPENLQSDFPNIPKGLKEELKRIPVSLAPDRKAAEHYVTERHLTSTMAEWSVPAKITRTGLKYFEDKLDISEISADLGMKSSDVKRDIREYALYKYMLSLDWADSEKTQLLAEDLKLNPFIYTFQARGVTDKLQMKFENGFQITSGLDEEVFKCVIKSIARAALIPNDEGKIELNTRSNFLSFIELFMADCEIKPIDESEEGEGDEGRGEDHDTNGDSEEEDEDEENEGQEIGPRNNNGRIYTHLQNYIRDDHIINLTKEVMKLPIKTYPNSASALLRMFYESILRFHYNGTDSRKKTIESLVDFHIQKETYGLSMKKVLAHFKKSGLVKLDLTIHGHRKGNPDTVKEVADEMYEWIKIALAKTD